LFSEEWTEGLVKIGDEIGRDFLQFDVEVLFGGVHGDGGGELMRAGFEWGRELN
jgi:hypothetical protein